MIEYYNPYIEISSLLIIKTAHVCLSFFSGKRERTAASEKINFMTFSKWTAD